MYPVTLDTRVKYYQKEDADSTYLLVTFYAQDKY